MLSPERVRVPAPALVSVPFEMTPLIVTSESVVRVRDAAPRSTVPPKVSTPVLVPLPKVTLPPIVRLFAIDRAPAAATVALLASTPPLRASAPLPRAVFVPMSTVPKERVKPPVKPLLPVSVTEPAVVFVAAAVPPRSTATEPDWRSKVSVVLTVKAPVPVIAPPETVSLPIVSVKAPRLSVPPATVTAPLSWSLAA